LLTGYSGGVCPISKEDQDILDQKTKLEDAIKYLKDNDLCSQKQEDQLKALKVPDVANNHLKYKTSLDARLLEIEQKAATAKTQYEAQLLKLDETEQLEIATLATEVKTWWEEYEIKRDVARADREAAKLRYEADRAALIEKDRLRIAEQASLTAAAIASLNNLGHAAPTPLTSAGTAAPAAPAPPPPVVAILPSMVSLADLQAHVLTDSMYKGSPQEAQAFAQSMLNYLDKKVQQNAALDATMADPDIEFESETDNDVDQGATSSATKVKKKYKMKQSERDARTARKGKPKQQP
jgi:hypothetical protein